MQVTTLGDTGVLENDESAAPPRPSKRLALFHTARWNADKSSADRRSQRSMSTFPSIPYSIIPSLMRYAEWKEEITVF
ncbi:hypothetical protein NPX13_g9842 [Xylaria arbuscula]|uniref:Uncharacterized protein n=1 Tax=Xylaria arbuscula TaxID=114810 RepID=A0A9W8TIH4_9PEZI|nr:hypothetical protein NPX13_g9842 [Xylaria arbuscula]